MIALAVIVLLASAVAAVVLLLAWSLAVAAARPVPPRSEYDEEAS